MASAYDRPPLGALRMFEAVFSHLSVAVATQEPNVTPGTVSQQIKTLEAYVQASLFRRTGRRAEITAEGLELLLSERSECCSAASYA